jgi:hypothetical protein
MQSKFPTPPAKTYYKLNHTHMRWQRCLPDEGELVVCTEAPRRSAYNRFMYAIDLRSQQKIKRLAEIAVEIQIDINFGVPLPPIKTGGLETTNYINEVL